MTSDPLPTPVVELRTTFHHHLVKFHQLQSHYQQETTPLLAGIPSTDRDLDTIHMLPLLLPSSLPSETLSHCSNWLISMEKKLRIGQCHDSLAQLRMKLTSQACILRYKYVHVCHQAPNTRSRNLLNRINTKIDTIVAKYHRAFTALQVLDIHNESKWRSEFQELRKQDVCCLSQAALPNAPTQEHADELHARTLLNGVAPEGSQTVSWIWRGSLKGNPKDQGSDGEYNEGQSTFYSMHTLLTTTQAEFHLEWSKAYARQA